MLAYSQVDQAVRRKLEEMLKTWREPVPGSLSSTPVFPLNATQSIFEALNKFKSATAARPPPQGIRPHSIVQAQGVQYRQSPTPTQMGTPYQQPQINLNQPTPTPSVQPQYPPYYQQPPSHTPVQYPVQPLQNHTPIQQYPVFSFPPQQAQLPPRPGVDVRKLHSDIDDLTTDAKIDCMTHPMDQAKSRKLETLQSLKAFLDSGNLGEQDLRDVRETITKETEKRNAEKLAAQHLNNIPTPQPQYQPPPQWPTPNPYQQQPAYTPVAAPPAQQQYVPPPQQIPSFIGQTNLAELLRHAQNSTPRAQPTQTSTYAAPAASTPSLQPALLAPTNGTLSLIDQIRASGILSKVATPLQGVTPPMSYAQPNLEEVPFTSASIKIPRPHLVLKFINEKPNQCSTCGRRFTSDDIGKAKKEKHLDWHFKTKTRSLEAEQRGQNRSWYVDEHEWVGSKEYEDDLGMEDPAASTNGTSASAATKKEEDFVRTPSNPAYRNATCPIDQEPFKSEWSADIQDFIWRDAIKVGDKYYHASCYREAMKTKEVVQPVRAGTPLAGLGHRRTATPDSILGKRKAEDDEPNSASNSRLKLEV